MASQKAVIKSVNGASLEETRHGAMQSVERFGDGIHFEQPWIAVDGRGAQTSGFIPSHRCGPERRHCF